MAQTTAKKTASETAKKTTAKKEAETSAAAETAAKAEAAEVSALMAEIEALKQQLAEQKAAPQVVQIKTEKERVHLLWQAEVAQENKLSFGENGKYGSIYGKTGSVYIPKDEFSHVLNDQVRYFLEKRWLIVVSGLTDDEREAFGVAYKPGEMLTEKAFAKIVEMGDDLLTLYPQLCEGHRRIVAQRYAEAFAAGDDDVTRDIVTKLNEMSKQAGSANPRGDFISIIEAMNEADAQ